MKKLVDFMRARAIDHVNEMDVLDLLNQFPANIFDMMESPDPNSAPPKEESKNPEKSSVPQVPAVALVPEKESRASTKKSGRVPKKPGHLTDQKRHAILEKVGDQDIKTPKYSKTRDALCRELGLSRRQVTRFVIETRKVKAGVSSIKRAQAARKRSSKKSKKAHKAGK